MYYKSAVAGVQLIERFKLLDTLLDKGNAKLHKYGVHKTLDLARDNK